MRTLSMKVAIQWLRLEESVTKLKPSSNKFSKRLKNFLRLYKSNSYKL
jgi:hypothetical protein